MAKSVLKSIFTAALAVVMLGGVIFFAACGGEEETKKEDPDETVEAGFNPTAPSSSVHTWVLSEIKEATCGEAQRAYYTCSHCDHTTFVLGSPATGEHTMQNGVCTTCGYVDPASITQDEALATYGYYLVDDKDESGTYSTGDRVLFGSYPQSLVDDASTLASLSSYETDVPTAADDASYSGEWTSYGYYDSGAISDYMFYRDVTLENGESYRGVYMLKYRPFYFYLDAISANSFIESADGYQLDTVYWFKYEPICWNVLDYADGQLFLSSRYALDAQPFQDTYEGSGESGAVTHMDSNTNVNDWESSSLRAFLNDGFYNLAFDETERGMIQETLLDNKYSGTSETNEYQINQNDTTDKVFLLSYDDVINSDYGYSFASSRFGEVRRRSFTQYSTVQGCRPSRAETNIDNKTVEGEDVCYYSLRSASNSTFGICGVDKAGGAISEGDSRTECIDPETWNGGTGESVDGVAFNGDYGILPALYLKVK